MRPPPAPDLDRAHGRAARIWQLQPNRLTRQSRGTALQRERRAGGGRLQLPKSPAEVPVSASHPQPPTGPPLPAVLRDTQAPRACLAAELAPARPAAALLADHHYALPA